MDITGCMVLTSIDSFEKAQLLSKRVVLQKYAACAQISSKVESIYEWQGKIERSDEYLIQFKTNSVRLDQLMVFIAQEHPYDTPEIISIDIDKMDQKYLNWLNRVISPDIT